MAASWCLLGGPTLPGPGADVPDFALALDAFVGGFVDKLSDMVALH
jgi:hypothetical protein